MKKTTNVKDDGAYEVDLLILYIEFCCGVIIAALLIYSFKYAINYFCYPRTTKN